jgi:hypothetical protein
VLKGYYIRSRARLVKEGGNQMAYFYIDINTNRNSILFGKINNFRSYRLENLTILTIKYYIYTNKFTPSKNQNYETLKQYL